MVAIGLLIWLVVSCFFILWWGGCRLAEFPGCSVFLCFLQFRWFAGCALFVALYRLFTLFIDLVVECFGFWDLIVWCVMR